VARLSDKRICRGREFQLLGEVTLKGRDAKDDLAQEGTARRSELLTDFSYTVTRTLL